MDNEKVVLFGAGRIGKRVYETANADIVAVIDNNLENLDVSVWEVPIISIDEYIEKYSGIKIWITVLKVAEIENQLKNRGIFNYSIPIEVYETGNVGHDEDISHEKWVKYIIDMYDKDGYKVLEVGSRVVTGARIGRLFKHAQYTGFDYYDGENVDVIGDIHKLSSYFSEKFDLIFCSAVFEHLAMPWIASKEMIKCLKTGGCIFVETHYSYSSHERPWHFFQFSENALNILFPEAFGIKCLKKGCSNLIKARFSEKASKYLIGNVINDMYCHSEFLGQKVEDKDIDSIKWEDLSLENVVGSTEYPRP